MKRKEKKGRERREKGARERELRPGGPVTGRSSARRRRWPPFLFFFYISFYLCIYICVLFERREKQKKNKRKYAMYSKEENIDGG
ncbi:hypothetical protein V6Z11_A08G290000 [Gossypium hirsutum]